MAANLPNRLTLSEARKAKVALHASLEARDLELLVALTKENPRTTIFGGTGQDETTVVITVDTSWVKYDSIGRRLTRGNTKRERTPDAARVNALVKAGWLRFARQSLPNEKPLGLFWMTESAKTLFRACREGKTPLLENK